MLIPEQKIDEVRNAIDIVDLVSQYVQLRKRGKNFVGLCPFHTEKTPSFSVSSDKQIYHCFGCHNGGNIFKFLMEYKKISYVEAIQEAAAFAGIIIEFETKKNYSKDVSETELLYDINYEIAKFYSDNLLSKPEGEFARRYFDNRKIKITSLRAFGLGFAPHRDATIKFIQEKKLDIDKAIYLGIIGKSENGNLYDRFYGRIIFPLFSPNGRVIGFAGRLIEDNPQAGKYVNSPESKIYYKGRTLYGLSYAKDEIRKKDLAIVVEGYMDLISLYQSGIKNVVAASGTAFTDDQAVLLSRYTKNCVLTFDADSAGQQATHRSIEVLLKKDFNVNIISLPKGEDPDSYVRKFGANEFINLVTSAQHFLEFQASSFQKEGQLDDPVKSSDAIRQLVKTISLVSDDLKRNLLIKSVAKKFNLREMLIEAETDKLLNKSSPSPSHSPSGNSGKSNGAVSQRISAKNEKLLKSEMEIIKLLLEGKSKIANLIFSNLTTDDLTTEELRRAFGIIRDIYETTGKTGISSLVDHTEDEEFNKSMINLSFEKHKISERWVDYDKSQNTDYSDKAVFDSIKTIRMQKLEREHSLLLQDLNSAHTSDEIFDIMNRIDSIYRQKKDLDNTTINS
ncbi:MAG: DNA primase [Ignavibacteriaceae bacterium]